MNNLNANCGCDNNSGWGLFGGNSCCSWIIILILLSSCCGNGSGLFGRNNGCGCGCDNDSWIWIILLLCFCNNGSCGGCGNSCC